MTQGTSKLGYIRELDGLRGVAILMVMFFHADSPFVAGGFIGVDIFFVLSGFLITTLLIQEFDAWGSISLKKFYMRRVLRLGPALVAMLLVFCLASFLFLDKVQANRNYIDALISLFYLSNWARALSIHAPDFIGHTWSLSIEEQFYLAWPIILLALLRILKKRYYVAIIAAAIAAISWGIRIYLYHQGASFDRLYNGLDTRVDMLMAGCTIGAVLSSGPVRDEVKKWLRKILLLSAPLAAMGLFYIANQLRWKTAFLYYFGFFSVEILTVVLILDIFMTRWSITRKLLGMRVLVWIGSISYGLYLWHYPIFRAIQYLGYYGNSVLTVGSLITFCVATVSFYAMERPILKLKARFSITSVGSSRDRRFFGTTPPEKTSETVTPLLKIMDN